MTHVLPALQPLFMLTAMSSAGFNSSIRFTVRGLVCDEAGDPVADADVLIISAAELKRTITSDDGSFTVYIYVSGLCDEITVCASRGNKRGSSVVPAQGGGTIVTIQIKDAAR